MNLTPTPTPTPDMVASLAAAVQRLEFWEAILIVLAFGALGGWAHRLGAAKEDLTPPLAYAILGSASALAALFFFNTTEPPLKVIGLSVIAGYGGKAILSALQARVEAVAAKSEAVKAKEVAKKAIETGKEAVQRAEVVAKEAGRERHQLARHLTEDPNRPAREVARELVGSGHSVRLSPLLATEIEPANAEKLVEAAADPELAALKELRGRLDGLAASLKS